MVGMVSGLSAKDYEGKLAELGLESLQARRRNADIYTVHKIVHEVGDLDSSVWFEKLAGNTVTRARADPLNIKCNTGRLELRKNFFSNRVVNDWNAIPADIKQILIPGKFKLALHKWQGGVRAGQQRAGRHMA
jgi:predicted secreted protein